MGLGHGGHGPGPKHHAACLAVAAAAAMPYLRRCLVA